jgi:hypothetical protein
MKRLAVFGVAVVAVVGLFAQPALAASPHLKGNMNRPGFGRGSGYWVVAWMAGVV